MVEVPMYRANGTRVELVDLLAQVPANDWVWSVLEFDGVGQMPSGQSLSEFQERLLEQHRGLIQTWNEIWKFAEALDYTIDCLVVAVSRVEQLEVDQLMEDDFQQCEFAFRAIDSTVWILAASDSTLLSNVESAAHDSR
jgi:hypothetical protein